MNLSEITSQFKKKSWLRLCTLHGIDKWELVKFINEPVYSSKYLVGDGLTVSTDKCLSCGAKFDLGIHKGTFIAYRTCTCGNDGTCLLTMDKLRTMFPLQTASEIFKNISKAKTVGFANTMGHWEAKGVATEDALKLIKEVQKARSLKSPSAKPGAVGYSPRSVDYWIRKGQSLDQALESTKKFQTKNGITWYTNRYGVEDGTARYNERICRWLSAEGMRRQTHKQSKISMRLFSYLGEGAFGDNEQTVKGHSMYHRVDFIRGNKIIEFFGDYWHGNPKMFSGDGKIRKKKVSDVWAHDKRKIDDLTKAGFKVLVIWESDFKRDIDSTVNQCLEFLKNEN